MPEPRVEQTVDETARVWAAAIVSRLTLPLGTDAPLGALTVAHGEARPRGFTMLCQRIARVLAESAELLLSQAVAREQLNAERESLRRQTMTDPMTGLGNRAAWDSALAMAVARQHQTGDPFVVLTFDVDGLKAVNDRYGHAAGDALLRDAAGLLRASVRDEDLVARTGGDEFQILLARGDRSSARREAKPLRRAEL
jgi:PleD family two-component response regulator